MAIEFTCVLVNGAWIPATSHDAEVSQSLKGARRFSTVQVKDRSLQHHRLYFGGLLRLTLDYWEPKGGLISPAEIDTLRKFSRWLDIKSGKTGAIHNAAKVFLTELRDRRAQTIQTPHKSIDALHEWVKVEAGYYDLIVTPAGVRKKARSINFNAMDQDQFNEFYKAAFSVCWRVILSRTFASEDECQNVIDQLLMMG